MYARISSQKCHNTCTRERMSCHFKRNNNQVSKESGIKQSETKGIRFKMATVIRAELSKNNKYWISKHRHYELKHFCLQYPEWKRACAIRSGKSAALSTLTTSLINHDCLYPKNSNASNTSNTSTLSNYTDQIALVERIAVETDPYLYEYIIKGVTEGRSYTYLKAVLGMPCGRDMYYDRYRKFFWLLNQARG